MTLREVIGQLDWKASAKKADYRTHWRIYALVMLGAVVATYVFHRLYPDAFWFLVLWCGFATGSAVGLVPGTLWQLASPGRIHTTSGRLIVLSALGWGGFSVAALLVLSPMMRAQESERNAFRALATEKVVAVVAHGRCAAKSITATDELSEFLRHIGAAELYYPSHEGSVREFTLSFSMAGGKSVEFAAGIPERHLEDISVRTGAGEMLVEGARRILGVEPSQCAGGCEQRVADANANETISGHSCQDPDRQGSTKP